MVLYSYFLLNRNAKACQVYTLAPLGKSAADQRLSIGRKRQHYFLPANNEYDGQPLATPVFGTPVGLLCIEEAEVYSIDASKARGNACSQCLIPSSFDYQVNPTIYSSEHWLFDRIGAMAQVSSQDPSAGLRENSPLF